jgi:hypothetical protein
LSELSTLDEDVDIAFELVLIAARAKSRLLDEFERLRLDIWFAEMLAFNELSELSTLDEDVETRFELALTAPRAASRLDDD